MNDRERWDARYAEVTRPAEPSAFVTEQAAVLPSRGRAADLAGGTGGTALWIAERGLHTTLVDVSPRALDIAGAEADRRRVPLTTLACDLEADGALDEVVDALGELDLVVVTNYHHPPLWARLVDLLAPGGVALCLVATTTNLERNEHPRRPFLVEPGELVTLCAGLEPMSFAEDWFGDRHEARLVARAPGSGQAVSER
jgi:SAM-dependent methyltransferase